MNNDLTTAQAAERLNVGKSTVRLWCTQGLFPGARAEETPRGPVWLIPEEDIRNFSKPAKGRPRKVTKEGASS